MRRYPPLPRLLAAATAFAVWCGVGVLPAVHGWRVAAAEAEFHAKVQEPGRPTVLPPGSGHDHHDEASCSLCPFFTSARGSASARVAHVPARPSGAFASALHSAAARLAGQGHASPRAPPAVS